MGCPVCGRGMCDCSPKERGQTQDEMQEQYRREISAQSEKVNEGNDGTGKKICDCGTRRSPGKSPFCEQENRCPEGKKCCKERTCPQCQKPFGYIVPGFCYPRYYDYCRECFLRRGEGAW